jgi:hypothetical protein
MKEPPGRLVGGPGGGSGGNVLARGSANGGARGDGREGTVGVLVRVLVGVVVEAPGGAGVLLADVLIRLHGGGADLGGGHGRGSFEGGGAGPHHRSGAADRPAGGGGEDAGFRWAGGVNGRRPLKDDTGTNWDP